MGSSRMKMVCILLCALQAAALAADDAPADDASGGMTIAPLPILFYSPETKLGFGAALNVFRRPEGASEDARPSTLTPVLIYTVKNQVISAIAGSHYWDEEKNHLSAELSYTNFPDNFYGLGNDTSEDHEEEYTTETYGAGLGYLRLLRDHFRVGLSGNVGHAKILERDEPGFLSSGEVLGSDGGWVSGLGVSLNYDDRDDITYATSGGSTSLDLTVFDSALGSDYDFRISSFSSQRYFGLNERTVLATRGLFVHVDGEAPFQLLPSLGGDSLLRGHYGGRFRDRDLLALEGEVRRDVWRRLGIALFGGVGQVAHNPGDLAFDEFHATFGFGLRYLFLSSEHLNIRFDFGFSEDESGSYISLGEAF